MSQQVHFSKLALMTTGERAVVLGELVASARAERNGQAAEIEARIRAFENRYELTSVALLQRLAAGAQRETAEIAEWLFWLRVRDDAAEEQARP